MIFATMNTSQAVNCEKYNGGADFAERIVPYNPEGGDTKIGKSVEYALRPDVKYWFPIRATHHRAQKIYDKIVSLRNDCLEPYLPILRHIEYTNEDFNNPTQYIADKPLDTGLLFLKSTLNDFKTLLQYESMFPGMTPYYNHFCTNEFGKNEFLVVPERQMQSFRIIVESGNENIIVRQNEMPERPRRCHRRAVRRGRGNCDEIQASEKGVCGIARGWQVRDGVCAGGVDTTGQCIIHNA